MDAKKIFYKFVALDRKHGCVSKHYSQDYHL